MRGAILTLLMVVGFAAQAVAQGEFGVAYYDVERFYDTEPSKFYDDRDYTPDGRLRWTTERYRHKVENIARVIDSMRMPVVMLYGVENEQVVRDIVATANEDYAYLHRTQDYNNGLDFAMLYFADRFFVDKVTSWRGALCVEGEANGQPLTIVATSRCSSLGVLFEERNLLREGNRVVVLGEPSRRRFQTLGLKDCSTMAERAGRGNIFRSGRWVMRDRVASNISANDGCDVYVKSWLLDANGLPKPTFGGGKYRGGYSISLPIYIYFEEIFEL